MDYRAVRRRHRRRQRDRPPHQVAGARARSRPACCPTSDRSAACSGSIATRYREPVLVSSADGVGTKLKVAFMTGRHDTVGADLVNHCVNDILVQGARAAVLPRLPRDRPAVARRRRAGRRAASRAACRENGCALIGGETAEMPGLLRRRRVRHRRLHRRRRRAGAASIDGRGDRAGRRADRPAVGRAAHQRLLAGAARVLRRRPGSTPDTFVPELGDDGRRRAAGAASVVSARSCGRCSSAAASRGWRTSPAAASPRTCRGCCRRAARRRSICSAWTVPPIFQLHCSSAAASRATRCSARSTWASASSSSAPRRRGAGARHRGRRGRAERRSVSASSSPATAACAMSVISEGVGSHLQFLHGLPCARAMASRAKRPRHCLSPSHRRQTATLLRIASRTRQARPDRQAIRETRANRRLRHGPVIGCVYGVR